MAPDKRTARKNRPAPTAEPATDEGRKISRSKLLAGGAAAAASISLGQADAALADVASDDANALEFVIKADQVGGRFTTYGYLTHVAGLRASLLFSPASRQSERTAHFTLYSVTEMQSRSVLEAVHALAVAGSMDVYLRQDPGAKFENPNSFKQGKVIASYAVTLQSIVSVTAPRKGVETLSGTLRQTRADRFAFSGGSRILGKKGLRLRLEATGTGRLLEPKQPRAVLVLAGNAVVSA
jgi:hypothetical protein